MNVSKFGKKMAVQSGIGQLMDDLGAAQSQAQEILMLGGGNPAHIPQVERCLRQSMTALLADGNRFEHAVGSYDPPEGSAEFVEAVAHLLRGRFGWDIGRRNIALTSGSQLAFFILFNLFAGDYEDGTKKKVLFPLIPEYIGYCDVGLTRDFFTAQRPKIESIDEHTFKYHIDFERLEIAEDIGADLRLPTHEPHGQCPDECGARTPQPSCSGQGDSADRRQRLRNAVSQHRLHRRRAAVE